MNWRERYSWTLVDINKIKPGDYIKVNKQADNSSWIFGNFGKVFKVDKVIKRLPLHLQGVEVIVHKKDWHCGEWYEDGDTPAICFIGIKDVLYNDTN